MPLIIFCWHAKHWPPSRLSAFLNSSSAPVLSSSCTSLRPSWYAFCTFSLTGPPCGSWVVSGAFYRPKRSKGIPQCLSFLYIVNRGFLPTLAQTPDRPSPRRTHETQPYYRYSDDTDTAFVNQCSEYLCTGTNRGDRTFQLHGRKGRNASRDLHHQPALLVCD